MHHLTLEIIGGWEEDTLWSQSMGEARVEPQDAGVQVRQWRFSYHYSLLSWLKIMYDYKRYIYMYARHWLILRRLFFCSTILRKLQTWKFGFCGQMNMNIDGDKFHEMIISIWKTCFVSHIGVVGFLRALFDPMEGLKSVYAQDIYGVTRESKIMEHQGSDLIWGWNKLMAKNSALLLTNSFVHEFESLVKFNMLVTKLLRSIFHRSIVCYQQRQTATTISTEDWKQRDHDRAITKPKSLKRNRDNTGSHVLIVHHPQYDSENGSLKLIYYENQWKTKKPRTEKERVDSSNISFQHSTSLIAQMKEIIYTPSMEIMGQMHFM